MERMAPMCLATVYLLSVHTWNIKGADFVAVFPQDEDDLALEKYQRQDEAKVKELNMHIEKMSKEVRMPGLSYL
eukprot:scaffold115759_cov17-Prasinocladus_malaysianus.AAC.1